MRRFMIGLAGVAILVGAAGAQLPATTPIPTELAAAAPWIGRNFNTGLIPMRHVHETRTLRRHGVQALLTIETLHAKRGVMDLGPWKAQPVKTYLGTAVEKAKIVKLELVNVTDPTDKIAIQCRRTTVAAAAPTAVRRATIPADREECGDTGRWHPRATKQVTVLLCLPLDDNKLDLDDLSTWEDASHLAFAPSPGIERLAVNDDCLQGVGWRRVPKDRSIVMKVRYGSSLPDAVSR